MIDRRRAFTSPLFWFCLTVLWGLAIAYDIRPAAGKLALISSGLILAHVLTRLPSHAAWHGRNLPVLRIVVAVVPSLIACYFLLTTDWTQPVDKVAWLAPLQRALAALPVSRELPPLHPNTAGGVLAMLLPLQAAAVSARSPRAGRPASWRVTAKGVSLVGLSVFALAATRLRGAWIALAASGFLWVVWRVFLWSKHDTYGNGRFRYLAGAAGLVPVAALAAAWAPDWLGARPDRVFVWGNSWELARDYLFTGVGLGSFAMPYSSYSVLLHVPQTTHAHNLFLDIWLEQGIAGLLAFLWVIAAAVLPQLQTIRPTVEGAHCAGPPWWHGAALCSTLVVLLHGLIDDPFYGYGGVGAMLLFIPVALLSRRDGATRSRPSILVPQKRRLLAALAAAALIVIAALPSTRAVYHANVGALLQTRVELALYRWPSFAVQDGVRRAEIARLAGPIDHYLAALALDPDNAVANRRLGQIELALGASDAARAHLEAAYRVAPNHTTRQMLGESVALTGDPAGAARLWRGLPLAEERLAIRREWYDGTGDYAGAAWVREAIAHTLAEDH